MKTTNIDRRDLSIDIEKLSPQPGDILVVRPITSCPIRADQREQLRVAIQKIVGDGVKVLVADTRLDVELIHETPLEFLPSDPEMKAKVTVLSSRARFRRN